MLLEARTTHGVLPVSYDDDVHPYTDLVSGRVDAVLLDHVLAERSLRRIGGFVVQPAAPLTLGAPRQAGFNHAGKNSVKFSTVDFTGIITVTDQEKFRAALVNGIGRQKAHGAGLIILNPGR